MFYVQKKCHNPLKRTAIGIVLIFQLTLCNCSQPVCQIDEVRAVAETHKFEKQVPTFSGTTNGDLLEYTLELLSFSKELYINYNFVLEIINAASH